MPKKLEIRESPNYPLTELLATHFELKDLDRSNRSKISGLVKAAYLLERGEEPKPCYRLNKRGVREKRSVGYELEDLPLIERVLAAIG